jgi:hypothetical protein
LLKTVTPILQCLQSRLHCPLLCGGFQRTFPFCVPQLSPCLSTASLDRSSSAELNCKSSWPSLRSLASYPSHNRPSIVASRDRAENTMSRVVGLAGAFRGLVAFNDWSFCWLEQMWHSAYCSKCLFSAYSPRHHVGLSPTSNTTSGRSVKANNQPRICS